jgi:hypothetical protein
VRQACAARFRFTPSIEMATSRCRLPVFASAVFLSAFLLFQVQPLLGKCILPWFGGTPAVWTTCMLFFQTVLFLGYAYAHLLCVRLSPRGQLLVHAGLIAAAALTLPILPSDDWKPSGGENPVALILLLLAASVGLPFFVLSSTGPLLQSWFANTADSRHASAKESASPYRLYALSNAGSLLALVSYPFLFEPAFDSATQAALWSWGFLAFGAACVACAAMMCRACSGAYGVRNAEYSTDEVIDSTRDSAQRRLAEPALWFCLSMAASVLLLAVTNQVCQDVAAVPFLWVMPLSIYLLSFILCFDGSRWYSRRAYALAAAVSSLCVAIVMLQGAVVALPVQVAVYFAALFFGTMACHGELANLKPEPRRLTRFYLVVAAGGAAGGLFVGVAAPLLFPVYLELHAALLGAWVLMLFVVFRDRGWVLYAGRPRWAWGLLLLGIFGLTVVLKAHAGSSLNGSIEVARNFYGVLRVQEIAADDPDRRCRTLVHGQIVHGLQFVAEKKRGVPTTYYGRESGIGRVLDVGRPFRADADGLERPSYLRVGVVGLGVGTLATYALPGDEYRFYEINPDVVRLADKHFTFLSDCRGQVSVVTADARLALERERGEPLDVLVVDAFSGDAVPAHLLTREAFDVYRRRLKPDGVLAFHISNHYFDLRPVVAAGADHLGWQATVAETPADEEQRTNQTIWMVLARDLDQPEFARVLEIAAPYDGPRIEWTDQRSNLLEVLR